LISTAGLHNCIGPVVDYIIAHVLAMTEVATRARKFT